MTAPAMAILASNLRLSQQVDDGDENMSGRPTKRQKLSLGVRGIDEALAGGFDYGCIHAITCSIQQNSQELVLALLHSHLMASPPTNATVIDSTLSLDIHELHQLLENSDSEPKESEKQNLALERLDRLKIMKVFDYIGLTESVAELRMLLESDSGSEAAVPAAWMMKSTIENSESEDEMLDEINDAGAASSPAQTPGINVGSKNGLLIIDNISQIVMPLMKNNYAQGQATLSTFMRSLSHLTRSYGTCTVVVCNASNKPAAEDEGLSIFRSCTIRPSLGIGFGYLVDVQIYVHQISTGRNGHDDGPNVASVLEVVQDKPGGRLGRWAPFVRQADGKLRDLV